MRIQGRDPPYKSMRIHIIDFTTLGSCTTMYVHLSAALCGSHIQVHKFEKKTAFLIYKKNCNGGKLALLLK